LSKTEIAYQYIKQAILKNELIPFADISEEKIQQKLNISRTPVHEALKKLEIEQFIYIYPKKGTIVSAITLQLVSQIYEIRECLELYCIKKLCDEHSFEGLIKIKESYLNLPSDLNKEKIKNYLISLDSEFHKLIITSRNNSFINGIMENVYDHDYRVRYLLSNVMPDFLTPAMREHIGIIDAILAKKTEKSEDLLRKHLENAKSRTLNYFLNR